MDKGDKCFCVSDVIRTEFAFFVDSMVCKTTIYSLPSASTLSCHLDKLLSNCFLIRQLLFIWRNCRVKGGAEPLE